MLILDYNRHDTTVLSELCADLCFDWGTPVHFPAPYLCRSDAGIAGIIQHPGKRFKYCRVAKNLSFLYRTTSIFPDYHYLHPATYL